MAALLLQGLHVSTRSAVAWGNPALVLATALWTPTLCTFHSGSVIQEARVQPYTTPPCLTTRLPQMYRCVFNCFLNCTPFPSISPILPLSFTESPPMLPSNASPSTPRWSPPSAPRRLTFGTAALTQSRCQAILSGGEAQSWGNSAFYKKKHVLVSLHIMPLY